MLRFGTDNSTVWHCYGPSLTLMESLYHLFVRCSITVDNYKNGDLCTYVRGHFKIVIDTVWHRAVLALRTEGS
uniref:Uncharacterized protein n=1 Tax=Globodera rostochiensis TaxID=31243 RepID=A0A914HXD7_GLORO